MARKHKHEDHVNHEAWAIPYGDLVTLLFALFTVMYAVSSLNEGKFRVAAASMNAAFSGPQRSLQPIQIGETMPPNAVDMNQMNVSRPAAPSNDSGGGSTGELRRMAREIRAALAPLIEEKVVSVRSTAVGLEVEIQTDILFPSGTALLSTQAMSIMKRLAVVLKHFDHEVRVEGHTDDRPINTAQFPSNWELSSARAASVVHLLMREGVAPHRLAVIGAGEYKPVSPNDSDQGRNRNRRVVLVIPAQEGRGGEVDDLVTSIDIIQQRTEAPAEPAAPTPAPAPARSQKP